MRIVLAVNFDGESFKVKAMRFLCVTLGFVNLADHSRVHIQSPYLEDSERHAKQQRAFQENNLKFEENTRIGGYSVNSIVRILCKVNRRSACFQNRMAGV
jgi:hypothetical protein